MGGAGSAVNEVLQAAGCEVRVLNLGLPDRYIEQATQTEQLAEAGLLPDQLEHRIRGTWQELVSASASPRGVQAS
jgi:1-deoxy-D-xylulose-5-phosphate synthase